MSQTNEQKKAAAAAKRRQEAKGSRSVASVVDIGPYSPLIVSGLTLVGGCVLYHRKKEQSQARPPLPAPATQPRLPRKPPAAARSQRR